MSPVSRPLSVLVVDDFPDAADTTAAILTAAGFIARTARSGRECLAMAAADPPDVVVLELRLPGMDGYEVARRLDPGAGGGRPRLVAVTTAGTRVDRGRTATAGFDLHLLKPADPAVLVAALRRIERAKWATARQVVTRTGGPTEAEAVGLALLSL